MSNKHNSSVEKFSRFVQERFNDFKKRLNDLTTALATNDNEQKVAKANTAWQAGSSLQQALSRKDQPGWLQPIVSELHNYVINTGHQNHGAALIRTLGLNYGVAIGHEWAFDFSNDQGFDFDGVFRKFEAECRIPELFDKLVEILEQIVQCEDIDSRRVIQTLEIIIATLKKNRNGSYFGVMGTWDFVRTYLQKFAWNAFLEVPGLKVVVISLRETLEDGDKVMEKVHENVRNDLHNQLKQADFPMLEYHALPLPEPLAITDETVIDTEDTNAVGQEEQQDNIDS